MLLRPLHAWILLGVAAAGAVALSGCDHSAPPEPVEDATIRLMQYTHDQVNRVLVVKITAGEQRVEVQGVAVLSGGFSGTGLVEYDATVSPGRTLDLRVPLGDPVCDRAVSPDDVSVEFHVAGHGVVIEEPAGSDTLAAIHRQECAAERALDEVPLVWGPRWHTAGAGRRLVAVAHLRVGPVTSAGGVQLTALEQSVIFVPEVEDLPLTLTPGETRLLEVRFRPNRCDAHVWETSRGFQFTARLRIGGTTDDILVPVVPPRAKQQLLTQAWQEQCAR